MLKRARLAGRADRELLLCAACVAYLGPLDVAAVFPRGLQAAFGLVPGQGSGGAHLEHAVHGGDEGRVEAQ